MALDQVKAEIAAAATRAGRPAESVTLVAVSKQQPPERIEAALAAGQRVFGENRVQEALERWPPFESRFGPLTLHLIGPLQTNKARQALQLFDVIESVDREKLAAKLASERTPECRTRRFLVQVNTGEEPQKAGVAPEEAAVFVRLCRETYELPVTGLMAIPPHDQPPAPHFALLARLGAEAGVSELSMGMSADFEAAIEMGATSVRVGSRLFGARPRPA